jgi:P27 family predicted phage terminase small subunit
MKGPAPKPTALKLLQGNAGHRPINKREPKFGGVPVCPVWITDVAKAEWARVVADLSALDMLRGVDSASLAAYCLSYARWRSAEEIVTAEGQTVNEPVLNKLGEVVGHKVKRHPATTIAKDSLASMLRASALFGFDPSSRSRLSVGEPTAADPFADFMRGIGANEDIHAEEETIPNSR